MEMTALRGRTEPLECVVPLLGLLALVVVVFGALDLYGAAGLLCGVVGDGLLGCGVVEGGVLRGVPVPRS